LTRGRLHAQHAPSNRFARQVWDRAWAEAADRAIAVTPDDLRHALYALACGVHSSAHVDSRWGFTRVRAWLLLCLNDADLRAAQLLTSADDDQRRRYIWSIRRLAIPHAYIAHICRDKFPAYSDPHWDALPLHHLRQLSLTLRLRAHRPSVPLSVPSPL
jgi:hypothetical protein